MRETLTLGAGCETVSRLGFGGCPLGGHGWGATADEDEGKRAVQAAFDQGITFFDTADVYGLGRSEELLSQALGAERRSVVIASKFGVRWDAAGNTQKDLSPNYLDKALNASLRRLRLDRIPLYYAHWPDGSTPIEEVVGELDRRRQQGKIAAIGLSNFPAEDIVRARRVAPIAAVQAQHSLVNRETVERLRSAVESSDVPVVTWGSLAQGLLTGKFSATTTFPESDRRHRYPDFEGERYTANLKAVELLKATADRLGKSPAQVAIRWVLDTLPNSCVLFGAKRACQVVDNVGALGWRLDPETIAELALIPPKCRLSLAA